MVKKPTAVNIRAYNVGFGDCFLMIFEYGPKETDEKRCVLVDFGSTGRTPKMRPTVMNDVANDISDYVTKHCGGVLHGVVATHRHKDHISGYSGKSGKIIEKIKPKIVIQPWTEDPLAKRGAKSATAQSGKGGSVKGLAGLTNQYLQSLTDMHAFSASALAAASPRVGKLNEEKIKFIADDNLANREAIERLARMGKAGKAEYLHAGDKTKLEKLLPGVKVHVLGPPDLTQTESILKQRSSDKDEFWQFMQFWSMHAGSGGGKAISGKLFPDRKSVV